MSQSESEIRKIIKEAGMRMARENLVQGTWGNISVRLDDKRALITPSGLDYDVMTLEDLPVIDYYSMEWTGPRKPTSEKKIHAAILRARPDVDVVLHSHPTWGATFASTRISLPAINDEMKRVLGGDVRCAKFCIAGTDGLAKETVISLEGRNACFIANHGVFVVGKTMEDAFEACRVLENSCRSYLEAKTIEKTGAKEYSFDEALKLFDRLH